MTSGISIGAATSVLKNVFDLNLLNLTITSDAKTPMITAKVADKVATFKLTQAAESSVSFCHKALYHFVEKPPQMVTCLEALKE